MGLDIQRVERFFHEALERPPGERNTWLEHACADEPELLREVSDLLAAHEDDDEDDRLSQSAGAMRGLVDDLWISPRREGTSIGGYRVVRVVSSGGMGTVYEAEQTQPARRVALKILRLGLENGPALQRFEVESQILAHLNHKGIAHVYDSGTVDDAGRRVPWFAMEFVEDALPITRYAHDHALDVPRRLRLFADACEAVHHGHQKGVVHRDLKPANLLVDARGHLKVIDFGVAKTTDADLGLVTLQTMEGQLLGTLRYMSPEQAAGEGERVDTRSDVYSLGVVLYELLTNALPHALEGKSLMASVRILNEEEPDHVPLHAARVASDLVTIVRKALMRDRDARYDSAMALKDDIERFLRCEPITARPPSAFYVLRRFARRNRWLVTTTVLAIAALVFGIVGTTVHSVRAERARLAAERAAREAAWERDYLAQMLLDADPWVGLGPQVTLGDAIERAARRFAESPPPPGVERHLSATFGEVLLRLGHPREAAQHLERSIALHDGTEARELHRLRRGLVRAWVESQRLEEARALALELLEDAHALFGPDGEETLATRRSYSKVLVAEGRLDEALREDRALLADLERVLGSDAPATVGARNDCGTVLQQLGRREEAEPLLRAVFEARRTSLGLLHPDTFNAANNLAATLYTLGRTDEATRYYEFALEGQTIRLGEDHPDTLRTHNNLGILRRSRDELPAAERHLRLAVEGRRRRLGDDDPETLVSMSNLAVCLTARCRAEGVDLRADARIVEALEFYRRCEAALEKAQPPFDQNLVQALSNHANLLLLIMEFEDAYETYRRAVRIAEDHFSEARWELWSMRSGLGAAALFSGRVAEAQELLPEAHRRLLLLLGSEHPSVEAARVWLDQLERMNARSR
ncbi:MAG: serine/threonine protein kinase [Planctomycetes bacterium]|nr:serine/threonine protein kinase [Planctomycetota bacterium]